MMLITYVGQYWVSVSTRTSLVYGIAMLLTIRWENCSQEELSLSLSFWLVLTQCNVFLKQAVMGLRDSIKRHLKLPHAYVMEYKPHDASLRDNSSYRNTWLRGLAQSRWLYHVMWRRFGKLICNLGRYLDWTLYPIPYCTGGLQYQKKQNPGYFCVSMCSFRFSFTVHLVNFNGLTLDQNYKDVFSMKTGNYVLVYIITHVLKSNRMSIYNVTSYDDL